MFGYPYEVEASRIKGMESGMNWAMMFMEMDPTPEIMEDVANRCFSSWMNGDRLEAWSRGVLDILGIYMDREFVDGSV